MRTCLSPCYEGWGVLDECKPLFHKVVIKSLHRSIEFIISRSYIAVRATWS